MPRRSVMRQRRSMILNPSGSLLPRAPRGRRAGDERAAPSKTCDSWLRGSVDAPGGVRRFGPNHQRHADCPSPNAASPTEAVGEGRKNGSELSAFGLVRVHMQQSSTGTSTSTSTSSSSRRQFEPATGPRNFCKNLLDTPSINSYCTISVVQLAATRQGPGGQVDVSAHSAG